MKGNGGTLAVDRVDNNCEFLLDLLPCFHPPALYFSPRDHHLLPTAFVVDLLYYERVFRYISQNNSHLQFYFIF